MSETMNGVQLANETGEPRTYVYFYERLPAFLETYPTTDYCVDIAVYDVAEWHKELMDLYKEALKAGHNPDEIDSIPSLKSMHIGQDKVAEARLIERSTGDVLAREYAKKPVLGYKDAEALVTAARQRLAAALGFGSDQFIDDEHNDMESQQLTFTPTQIGGGDDGSGAETPESGEGNGAFDAGPVSAPESVPGATEPTDGDFGNAAEDLGPIKPGGAAY